MILSRRHCDKFTLAPRIAANDFSVVSLRSAMDRTSVDWRGYMPAITTPFTKDRRLDERALQRQANARGYTGTILVGRDLQSFVL